MNQGIIIQWMNTKFRTDYYAYNIKRTSKFNKDKVTNSLSVPYKPNWDDTYIYEGYI